MVNGRVEAYVHSDNVTPGKGGVLIKVTCKSDSAAKTDEFGVFARTAARMAYAAGATEWADVVAMSPGVEAARVALQGSLREPVAVEIVANTSL